LRPRDVADLAEIVARAAAAKQPLRIAGAGTWLDAGREVVPGARRLDLSALRGIVEYVPGDLTLTALAGTPLALIAEATAANGQWLSLDPFGSPQGTLGATLATASSGPLAATLGQPRDVALGLEFVSGTGERIRGGGRVVKNVAGFDFVRLQVGAWGTLGVISEVTVRLRGRPEVDQTIALRVPRATGALSLICARLREQRTAPLAAELVDATLAALLGLPAEETILFRLAGNEDAVAAEVAMVASLGDYVVLPSHTWQALAEVEPAQATVLRLPGLPAQVAATWQRARDIATGGTPMRHVSLGRGTVRVISAGPVEEALRLVTSARTRGRCIVERTVREGRRAMAAIAVDRLSARLRQAFDENGILNPGILGMGHE
jgi:glycolate oxidase FAD binding subunit